MRYGNKGLAGMIRILIDTNVIIDYLADRTPFADAAEQVLSLCESGKVTGMITANAITDIYYIVRKHLAEKNNRRHPDALLCSGSC